MLTEEFLQATILVLDNFPLAIAAAERLLQLEHLVLEGFNVELFSLAVGSDDHYVSTCDKSVL